MIPADPIPISKDQQPLLFALNVNQEYSDADNENPKYLSPTPKMAPILPTDFEYCNRTALTNNNQTAPPAITEFITITEEERKEGLIDADDQEIEDDIQYIINNPEDDNNNATYKRKQNDLKILQASEWVRIKHLW